MAQDKLSNIRSAVILGASRGIGKAVAEELSRQGIQKLYLVARNTKALAELASSLEGESEIIETDLLCDDACQKLLHYFEDTAEFPRHWIFCAGGFPGGLLHKTSFERYSWDEVDSILKLNLRMPMKMTHLIVPELLRSEQEGSLIYLSSQSGYHARPGLCPYSASKFGLNGFAKSLFPEVKENNIKVSLVAPGFVDTPLVPDSPNLNSKKMIQPEDVAKTISYALSLSPNCCPLEMHLLVQNKIYKF